MSIALALVVIAGAGPDQRSRAPSSASEKVARQTYNVYFPDIVVPEPGGIGVVRVVLSCARVSAITTIPDDWYVQTLRPNVQTEADWAEFKFASNAVEFAAGHGVSRLPRLRMLDGAVGIEVEDDSCFDITAEVRDDLATDWKIRLPKSKLRLRR